MPIMYESSIKAQHDEDTLIEFVNYIYDQFQQGNGGSMAIKHGFDTINTIIEYAQMLKDKQLYNILTVNELKQTNQDLKGCLSKYNLNLN